MSSNHYSGVVVPYPQHAEGRANLGGAEAVWCGLVDRQHQHPKENHGKGWWQTIPTHGHVLQH